MKDGIKDEVMEMMVTMPSNAHVEKLSIERGDKALLLTNGSDYITTVNLLSVEILPIRVQVYGGKTRDYT